MKIGLLATTLAFLALDRAGAAASADDAPHLVGWLLTFGASAIFGATRLIGSAIDSVMEV
jgi:hypothetical protein